MKNPFCAICLLYCFMTTFLEAQVNLNNGLVLYLPFSGNNLDMSGNGNNPTNYGATLTTDQFGNPNSAYYFNGSGNYMELINNATLQPSQISLSVKVKPSGFYGGLCYNNCIIDKGNTDYQPGNYGIRFTNAVSGNCNLPGYSTQNYRSDIGDISASSFTIPFGGTPYVDTSTWACIVSTYNGDSVHVYVNGVLRYAYHQAQLGSNGDNIFLGRKNSGSYPFWFHGVMDEVRIYNRVLNPQEIDSLCNFVNAPPPIVLNSYAAVSAYNPCTNALTVDATTGFSAGDTVLLIQMKGSSIDSTNTTAFGDILSYNDCGNYEVNVIQSITGTSISLQNNLTRTYDFTQGKVQLVSLPTFNNYTLSQPHSALPWNGSKGGVFAINVLNNLTLQNEINVNQLGFAGGVSNILNSSITNCNQFQFFDPPNIDNSAAKGEGITTVSVNKSYARGKLANAGGGGNGHNGGGGGGANIGAGGVGGSQYYSCNNNPNPNTTGGVGGTGLSYNTTSNKIFLGGGGGAGHSNNYSSNFPAQNLHTSDGAPGGGIVFIMAGNIISSGGSIKANGGHGYTCMNNNVYGVCHDGMGGGGAGGTVLIKSSSVTGNLNVEAKGGNGGNVSSAASLNQLGPGGGGGGGALWLSMATIPSTISSTLSGGNHGVCLNSGNDAWGSLNGNTGSALTALNIPVDIVPFQPPSGFITTGAPVTICPGGNAQLNAFGGVSYSWVNPATLSNASIPNPVATPATTTTYTVTGTNANGCTATSTQTVSVNPQPIVIATAIPSSVCLGGSATLSGSGAVSYSWSGGIQNGVPFVPLSTTTYTVTGTASNGCTATATITLFVNPLPVVTANATPQQVCTGSPCTLSGGGAVNYNWTGGLNNGVPFTPTSPGSYTVTGTDANGCTATSSISITLLPLPVITAQAIPSSVCAGNTVILNASGANGYIWSGGVQNNTPFIPASSGTYTVTGTDTNGCTATAIQGITVFPLPLVTATAMPDSVCSGSPTTLTGNGAVSYFWSQGVFNGVSFIPTVSNNYTVVGTDANNCTNTATVSIFVYTNLPIGIINTQPQICAGDSTQLSVTGGISYTWQPAASLGDTTGSTVWAYPIGVTQYTVTGTDIFGCSGTATTIVSTIPPIHVTTTKSNDIICGMQSAQLNAYGAEHYIWTPSGGLNNDTISNPMATVNQTTTYIVTGNTGGCYDDDTITVQYYTTTSEFVQLPTAFTPNGDGLNDCLHIIHNVPLSKFFITIYNRWGQKVYESNDPDACWDGMLKYGKADIDTYYYYIKSTSICGDIFVKGDVSIIR